MTDRHAGYIVVLADDRREDDAEEIVTALRMVKGVLSVEPVLAEFAVQIASDRRDIAWRDALLALIRSGPATETRHNDPDG